MHIVYSIITINTYLFFFILLSISTVVTYERVLGYAKNFFSRLHTECFIYGNVTKQRAQEIAGLVNKRLEDTNAKVLPLLARQMLPKREYKLCPGTLICRLDIWDK